MTGWKSDKNDRVDELLQVVPHVSKKIPKNILKKYN